jgi:hypothetical protein
LLPLFLLSHCIALLKFGYKNNAMPIIDS